MTNTDLPIATVRRLARADSKYGPHLSRRTPRCGDRPSADPRVASHTRVVVRSLTHESAGVSAFWARPIEPPCISLCQDPWNCANSQVQATLASAPGYVRESLRSLGACHR